MKICIDPGHGGDDPGAVPADGLPMEKDVALAIARAIHGKEPNLPGVQFSYTRMADKHFSEDPVQDLEARVSFANDIKADLFVSIHLNADEQRKGRGAETYHYYDSVQGCELAAAVQSKLVQNTDLQDRGVKQAGFYVTKYTAMPAILVEAGFIGGDLNEAKYVTRPDTISKIAVGIMTGIGNYLGVEYGPAKPAWDPQGEIDQLIKDGIINTPRAPDQPVKWGEFATVVNRIRRG